MIRTLLKGFTALLIVIVIIIAWALTINKPQQHKFKHYSLPEEIRTLQQNWTADIRQQMSHTSFGSQILPLSWLLNLEHPYKPSMLIDAKNMEALGFIPQQHATNNTYGLPLGFSIDAKEGEDWAGLTCAACHTAIVEFGAHKILIDGGAGQLDFVQFEQTLLQAVGLTLRDSERFERFAKAIPNTPTTKLKQALSQWHNKTAKRLAINKTQTPYGYGRLDAFGIIFNTVAVDALGVATNVRAPDAPVSIPVLWDASHLDVVQWNGSAPNKEPGPLGQNVPTALAVYGNIVMEANSFGGYSSSVRVKNLGYMQSRYYKLTAPSWPQDLLGELNQEQMQQGEKLYQAHCQQCHIVANNIDDKRQYTATLIPIESIGTDPVMANNFVDRRVSSGFLAGKNLAIIGGGKLADEVAPIDLVINAAAGVMLKKPFNTLSALAAEFQFNLPSPKLENKKVYKARQLNGIWTSAPYLHNGSVPSLWDLLTPEEQRPTLFYTGSRQLDTRKVGYQSTIIEGAPLPAATTLFDTSLYGNSNAGHNFGTTLTAIEKWALIEYLKSL